MSQEVENLFSSISPTYDRVNHWMSFNLDKRWRRLAIEQISSDRSQPIRVLDLCAGTFDLTLDFLDKFPNGRVWALDFSLGMLRSGLHKTKGLIGKQILPVCADGLQMPIVSEGLDVVFCGFGFRNFDDQKKALTEIHRVLKPGGELLILDFFRPTTFPVRLFHATYGRFLMPWVGGLISGRKDAYDYLNRSIAGFYSLDECKQLFAETGFKTRVVKNFAMGVTSLIVGEKTTKTR